MTEDTEARTDTKKLFDFFFDIFGVAVRSWAYAYMLPMQRSTASSLTGQITTAMPWRDCLWTQRNEVLSSRPGHGATVRSRSGSNSAVPISSFAGIGTVALTSAASLAPPSRD